MNNCDFLVVGAGIAGASMAARLAETHSVILVDMEERAGFHTTSRSAASYEPNYGPPPMLALTRASERFFKDPPPGFSDAPLFTARGSLFLEADGQTERTAKLLANAAKLEEISISDAMARLPVLRPNYAKRCFLDSFTGDLDVDLLHGGFLRLFKGRGGKTLLSSSLVGAERKQQQWHLRCGGNDITARTIVNAAGAWGDKVAGICGAQSVGLQPKRRSIGVVPMPDIEHFNHWPMVTDVGETWYAKPQSGKLIVSSADATPVDPHDAYADDMAIAEGIDRLMTATTIEVDRLHHSWGGLRSFAPDGNPVVGYDSEVEGFFWLIGQGGYGIQSSPALSEAAAALARHKPVPDRTLEFGFDVSAINANRFKS